MSLNKQEKVATRKVATSLLNANAVSKRYGGVQALDNASIELQPGEIRAICGENGAGKSTLVKILTGIVMPDNGTIEM
ncbi:MAG: ATP-binding cassette domain-containing protein, partial [OCS116 cluster bacterium]|nr:ATP-binding cassette domain-containing protein [OCS116 cluster bacterium]